MKKLKGLLLYIVLFSSIVIAEGTPKQDYNDVAMALYCSGEITGLVIMQEDTGSVLREWKNPGPTNQEFTAWVKEFYRVNNADDISFQFYQMNVCQ